MKDRVRRRVGGKMQRAEFSIQDIAQGRTMTLSDLSSLDAHMFECNKVRRASDGSLGSTSSLASPTLVSSPPTFWARIVGLKSRPR